MTGEETDLLNWMREDALPFWVDRGVDKRYGGFTENLDAQGAPADPGFKRVRVQGRQIFSFAMAALMGWHAEAAAVAEHGYKFLSKSAWREDGQFWVCRLSTDGAVIDGEFDLYDNAFVVLGLATYYRLSGNKQALDFIHKTAKTVRERLLSPLEIGYRQTPRDLKALRQNPNMHWFEAMQFCYEATGDARFLDEAAQINRLAGESLIDRKTGALRELFDNHWLPVSEGGKILVEPGHHYEWAWLLARAESNGIAVAPGAIDQLMTFANAYGVNATTGLVYDQVSAEGEVTQRTHRLWPQTEAIKAWLIARGIDEVERRNRVAQIEANLMRYYFSRPPAGSWGDRLEEDCRLQPGPVPASSLYHIMMCAVELARYREMDTVPAEKIAGRF